MKDNYYMSDLLASSTTEEIQSRVAAYIAREGRSEIIPLTKEVNCHREAAKMFLRGDEA